MHRRRGIKVAIFFTVIALFTSISMLIDSTYASNQFKASGSNFAVYLEQDGCPTELNSGSNTGIFTYNRWEPGYTQIEYFCIDCPGDTGFDYSFKLTANSSQLNHSFAEVFDVYYMVTDETLTRSDVTKMTHLGTLDKVINRTETPKLSSTNNSARFAIAIKMNESAGNAYQGKTLLKDNSGFHLHLTASNKLN